MAQPPAVVTQTFKPAGDLQLHRLRVRAGFLCVQCRKYKTASLVATRGGNWARTVCERCYGSAVHEQREKAKKAAKAKGRQGQATQRPSKKAELKQPEEKSERITQKELQGLQRRLPGVDRLLAFFRAAGVRTELVGGGCLWINGSQVELLRWILPTAKTLSWNDVIDEMALKYVRDKFIRAVEDNARFGEGIRVVLQWRERGFAIVHNDVRLGVIYATRAQIPRRDVIHANFLVPGPHWQQVARVLESVEPELVAEWKHEQEARAAAKTAAEAERRSVTARRRIDHLPSDLAPEIIAACLHASRRIRLERQVAYERPVILQYDFGELTVLPIAGTDTRLVIPFRLIKEAEMLNGELVLGDHDPLPLLIGEGVAEEDAITAWVCALLGFADATCIELEPAGSAARRESKRPRWRSPSSVPHRHSSTRTAPRRRPWPSHLKPVGQWARYSGSFVAGHRRRLDDRHMASAEARDRARQVGIILHPHETWVQAHTRGVPDSIEMRFLWEAPAELKLFHRRSTGRNEDKSAG